MDQIIEALGAPGASLEALDSALAKAAGQGSTSSTAQHLTLISRVCGLLTEGLPPELQSESDRHTRVAATRLKAIDILYRLPPNEGLRPALSEVTAALLFCMRGDGEENAAKAASALVLVIKQFKHQDRNRRAERDAWMRLPDIVEFAEGMLRDVTTATAEVANDGYEPSALADVAALSMGRGLVGPMKAVLAAVQAGSVARRPVGSRPAELAAILASRGGKDRAPPLLPGRYSPKVLLEVLSLLQTQSSSEPVRARCVPTEVPAGSSGAPAGGPPPRRAPGPLLAGIITFLRSVTLPDAACLALDIIPSQSQAPSMPYISRSRGGSGGSGSDVGSASGSGSDSHSGSAEVAGEVAPPGAGLARIRAQFLHDLAVANTRMHYLLASLLKPMNVPATEVIGAVMEQGGFDAFLSHLLLLLATLPPSCTASRREAFQVLRHYAATISECQLLTARELPLLLDTRVVLGSADPSTVPEIVRFTAWQTIADALYVSREAFTLEQLSAIVSCFAMVLRDPSSPAVIATIAARVLNALVEVIPLAPLAQPAYERGHGLPHPFSSGGGMPHPPPPDRTPVRALLVTILQAVVEKVGALRNTVPRALAAEKRALAEAETERTLHLRQIARISASAELVSTQTKARAAGLAAVPESAQQQAAILLEGLSRGSVSPWVADEYTELGNSGGGSAAGGSGGVSASAPIHSAHAGHKSVDSLRELRTLISVLMPIVRSCVYSLLAIGRSDGGEEDSNVVPPTPAPASSSGGGDAVTVVTVTAGGAAGLGQYAHGVTLGEGEIRALSRYLEWIIDAFDAFLLSPSMDAPELAFVCEEYARMLDELSKQDRNHLRDLLSSAVSTIFERCFRNSALYQLVEAMAAKSFLLCKIVIDMLLYQFTRNVHLLNVDDEDDSPSWRQFGPGAPSASASAPAPALPGLYSNEQAEWQLVNGQRISVSNDRRAKQILRGRMIAAGDWHFNEDGEFDAVLAPEQLTPDHELADQHARMPAYVLSMGINPGETLRKRALIYANMRSNVMLRVFRLCLTAFGIFAAAHGNPADAPDDQTASYRQQQADNIRVENLVQLQPFIGPVVRSLLRNALAVHNPNNHLQALRLLMRQLASELEALAHNPAAQNSVLAVYAEFGPLTHQLIDTLLRIHGATSDVSVRGQVIDVALSIPLRLNMQLPYLPKLLQMVILGLRWREDKRTYNVMALRTLSYWCDNISRAFWEHIFRDVTLHAELMTALIALLRQPAQPPTSSSQTSLSIEVLRILPKLGGLNRIHLGGTPRLSHSLYAAGPAGLTIPATWGADGTLVYVPPESASAHDQAKLETVFAGTHEGGVDGAGSRVARAGVDEDVDMDVSVGHAAGSTSSGTGRAALLDPDANEAGAIALARRAIATLRKRAGILPEAGGGDAGAGDDHRAGQPVGEHGGVQRVAAEPVDLPLDRILHCVHRMLTRHLTLSREGPGERPREDDPLLAPIDAPSAHAAAGAGSSLKHVRKRITPSSAAGTRGEEYAAPVRRRRRHDDDGQPLAIHPNHQHKALPVNVGASILASAEANAPVLVYRDAYASDSDSDGNEEAYDVGPITLTPTQQLALARRGAMVSKRSAWELLHSITPLILAQLPFLAVGGGGSITTAAAAHLYSSPGVVAAVSQAPAPVPWPPVGAAHAPGGSPPRGAAGGSGTTSSGSGAGKESDEASRLGYDGTAEVHADAERVAAARRAVLEYLHALALACADAALRPLAYPLFMTIVRSLVLRMVGATPPPLASHLPPALLAGGQCGAADSAPFHASTTMPVLSMTGDATLEEEGGADCPISGSGAFLRVNKSGDVLPLGAADPLLLNALLVSLACDEPPPAATLIGPAPHSSAFALSGAHPFKSLLLDMLDEVVGTLCLVAHVEGAAAASSSSSTSDSVSAMDVEGEGVTAPQAAVPSRQGTVPTADQTLQRTLRATMAEPMRCLHAVAVTGRLLLPDLLARIAVAAQQPSARSKQSACHALTALLARLGSAFAQAYGGEIIRIALLVLRTCEVEQAALTTVAAYTVVLDVVAASLPPSAAATTTGGAALGSVQEMLPLSDFALQPHDLDRLSAFVRVACDCIGATSASAREASACVLGAVVRHCVAPDAGGMYPPGTVARGVLTLLAPYATQVLGLHYRKRVNNLRAPEMVGYLCAMTCMFNLCAEANVGAPPVPAAGAAPDVVMSGSGGAAAPVSAPVFSGSHSWRSSLAVFTSAAFQKELATTGYTLYSYTRAYEINATQVNPAYSSAMGTTAMQLGSELKVLGAEGLMHGRNAPPLTVIGAVHASSAPAIATAAHLMVNISSASNPPIEVPRGVGEVHALLSAVQAYPYPLRSPHSDVPGTGGVMGPPGAVPASPGLPTRTPVSAAWTDPWQNLIDPFVTEHLSGGGRLLAHLHGLPRAVGGVLAQTIASVAASVSLQGVAPEASGLVADPDTVVSDLRGLRSSTDGYGTPLDPAELTLARAGGLPHIELQPRPYSQGRRVDVYPQFKLPNFPLLLRITTLGYVESLARAIPDVLTTGLPSGEEGEGGAGSASALAAYINEDGSIKVPENVNVRHDLPWMLRRYVVSYLLFETIPLHKPLGSNVVDWNNRQLIDDHFKLGTHAAGHQRTLLAALAGAFDAFSPLLNHALFKPVLSRGFRSILSLFSVLSSPSAPGAVGAQALPYTEGTGTQHLDTLSMLATARRSSFNKALAESMLAHLEKQWLNVNSIRDILLNTGREPEIAGALVNALSVLPLDPVTFLPEYARVAYLLDAKMHQFRNKGSLTSTVRRPFARFCSAYPAVVASWFFTPRHLLNPAWSSLLTGCAALVPDSTGFLQHMRTPGGFKQLVDACFADAPRHVHDAVVAATGVGESAGEAARTAAAFAASLRPEDVVHLHSVGILLLRAMAGTASGWLPSTPAAVAVLLHVWHAPTTQRLLLCPVAVSTGDTASLVLPPPTPHDRYSTASESNAAAVRALGTRQAFHSLPWRQSQAVWSSGGEHLQALQDLLLGLVQQVARRARVVAEARAEAVLREAEQGEEASPVTVPFSDAPAITYALLGPILCALLSSIHGQSRLNSASVRAVLEEEVATAPDAGLRAALFALFSARDEVPVGALTAIPPSPLAGGLMPGLRSAHGLSFGVFGPLADAIVGTEMGSAVAAMLEGAKDCENRDVALHVTAAAMGGSGASGLRPSGPAPAAYAALSLRCRALGLRHVVLPLTRHCIAAEETLSKLWAEARVGAEGSDNERVRAAVEARRLFALAGGRPEALSLDAVLRHFALQPAAPVGASTPGGDAFQSSVGQGGVASASSLSGRSAASVVDRSRGLSMGMEEDLGVHLDRLATPEPPLGSRAGSAAPPLPPDEDMVGTSSQGSVYGGVPPASGLTFSQGSRVRDGGGAGAAGVGSAQHVPAVHAAHHFSVRSPLTGTYGGPAGASYVPGSGSGGVRAPWGTDATHHLPGAVYRTPSQQGGASGGGRYGASGGHYGSGGRVGGGGMPGSGRGGVGMGGLSLGLSLSASQPSGGTASTPGYFTVSRGAQHLRTPFSPFTSSAPRLAGIPWGEAAYCHAPGAIQDSIPFHLRTRASKAAGLAKGADTAATGGSRQHPVFASTFPFPRLLPCRQMVDLFVSLVGDMEEEELLEANKVENSAGPLNAMPLTGHNATFAATVPTAVAAVIRAPLAELRVEVLRVLETLILSCGEEVYKHRNLAIRTAWRQIRRGEPSLRSQGLMFMGRYAQIFQLPGRSGVQLLVHLFAVLRPAPSQPSHSHLEYANVHRRALNILLPSMAMHSAKDKDEWRTVLNTLRKQLVEECVTTAASIALLPLLLDHARLLYPFRSAFVSALTALSHKIAQPASVSVTLPHQKALITDTLTVLAVWQAMSRLEHLLGGLAHVPVGVAPVLDAGSSGPTSSRRRQGDRPKSQYPFADSGLGGYDINGSPTPSPAAPSAGAPVSVEGSVGGSGGLPGVAEVDPGAAPSSNYELLTFSVGHAAKAALLAADTPDTRGALQQRSVALFASMLRLWPDVQLHPGFFARGYVTSQKLANMKLAHHQQAHAAASRAASAQGGSVGVDSRPHPLASQPSAMGGGSEDVHAYCTTALELMLAISGSEGRAVDFLAEHPGFLMESVLFPTFLSADKRISALGRRLCRRLLVLYPPSDAPLRIELSRLYHWILVASSFRVVLYNLLTNSMKAEDRKSYRSWAWAYINSQMRFLDQSPETRGQFKELLLALEKVAKGEAYPPALYRSPVDASGNPLPKQNERAARYSQYVAHFFPDFTPASAAAFLEAHENDKKLATAAWESSESELLHADLLCRPGTPGAPPPQQGMPMPQGYVAQGPHSLHVHALCVVRLLRECFKFAPGWNTWCSSFLVNPHDSPGTHSSLFSRLALYHLDAEEYADRAYAREARDGAEGDGGGGDRADPDIKSIRASMLVILIQLQVLRDTLTKPVRKDVITWTARLLNATSDSGVLRISFRFLSALLSAHPAGNGPQSVIPYGGVSEKKQRDLISSVFLFLSVHDMGAQGLNRPLHNRIRKVPTDTYHDVQEQYFNLLFRLAMGDAAAVGSVSSVVRALQSTSSRRVGSGVGAVTARPSLGEPSLAWLSALIKQFASGTLASYAGVRDKCLRVVIGYGRWRRVQDMGAEMERVAASREAAKEAAGARTAKRRAGGLTAPPMPGFAFPAQDPFESGKLALTSIDLQSTGFNCKPYRVFEDARFVFYSMPDTEDGGAAAKDILQSNVDPNSAAALEAALVAATGAVTSDRRRRCVAFSGVEGVRAGRSPILSALSAGASDGRKPPLSAHDLATLDAEAAGPVTALTALQDMLCIDWEGCRAYIWLQTAIRVLLQGLAVEGAPAGDLADAARTALRAAAADTADPLSVAHASALSASLTPRRGRFMAALSTASAYSADLSTHLWSRLFPTAWKALSPVARERLTPFLSYMLTRDSHDLYSKNNVTEHVKRTGNSLSQTSQILGVRLSDFDKDSGTPQGAFYGEGSWSSSASSSGIAEAAVGSSTFLIQTPEEPSHGASTGPSYAPPVTTDLSLVTSIQLFAGPILSACDPPVALPVEVVSFLGRSVGLWGHASRALEVRLETAVANVRATEERLRSVQKQHVEAAGAIAARTSSIVASALHRGVPKPGVSLDTLSALDTRGVYAAALAPNILLGAADVVTDLGHSTLSALSPVSIPLGVPVGAVSTAPPPPSSAQPGVPDEALLVTIAALRAALVQSKSEVSHIVQALSTLYTSVGLEEAALGLARRFATTVTTARGVDLEGSSLLQEASDTYSAAFPTAKEVLMTGLSAESRQVKDIAKAAAAALGLGPVPTTAPALEDKKSMSGSDAMVVEREPLPSAPVSRQLTSAEQLEFDLTGVAVKAAPAPSSRKRKADTAFLMLGAAPGVIQSTFLVQPTSVAVDRNGTAESSTSGAAPSASTFLPALLPAPVHVSAEALAALTPRTPSAAVRDAISMATSVAGRSVGVARAKSALRDLATSSACAHAVMSSVADGKASFHARGEALPAATRAIATARQKGMALGTQVTPLVATRGGGGEQRPEALDADGDEGMAVGSATLHSAAQAQHTVLSTSMVTARNRAALLRVLGTLEGGTPEAALLRDAEVAAIYGDIVAPAPHTTYATAGGVAGGTPGAGGDSALAPLPGGLQASTAGPPASSVDPSTGAPPPALPPPPLMETAPSWEVYTWEARWVETQRKLCNWRGLHAYSAKIADGVLHAEACAALGRWDDLMLLASGDTSLPQDAARNHASKLLTIALQVQSTRSSPPSVQLALEDVAYTWLTQWQALPAALTTANVAFPAHRQLLGSMQRITEVNEGLLIVNALRAGQDDARELRHNIRVDLDQLMATWRERLPTLADGALAWNQLLTWRQQLFSLVTDRAKSIDKEAARDEVKAVALQDLPWTVLTMGRVARKLGLRELAASQLARLLPSEIRAMRAEDNFFRIREELLLYLPDKQTVGAAAYTVRLNLQAIESLLADDRLKRAKESIASLSDGMYVPGAKPDALHETSVHRHARAGMQLAQSYSMDWMKADMRAELFRLQGCFAEVLGRDAWPAAYLAYSAAAAHCPTHAKSWLSWATYLDRLHARLRCEVRNPDYVLAIEGTSVHGTPSEEGGRHDPVAVRNGNGLFVAADLVVKFAGDMQRVRPKAKGGAGGDAMAVEGVAEGAGPLTVVPLAQLPTLVAAQAISAYVEAVSNACSLGPLELARALWLAYSGATHLGSSLPTVQGGDRARAEGVHVPSGDLIAAGNAKLIASLGTSAGNLPTWVWIPWLPQLMAGIGRAEENFVRVILKALVFTHPQSVQTAIRSLLAEKNEAWQAAGSPAPTPGVADPRVSLQRLWSELHQQHSGCMRELDALCTELEGRVNAGGRSSLEEDMLAQIHSWVGKATNTALQVSQHRIQAVVYQAAGVYAQSDVDRTLQQVAQRDSDMTASHCAQLVGRIMIKTLGVYAAEYLAAAGTQGHPTAQAMLRHNSALVQYRTAMLLDFAPTVSPSLLPPGAPTATHTPTGLQVPEGEVVNPYLPTSADQLLSRLRKWKARILASCTLRRMHRGVDRLGCSAVGSCTSTRAGGVSTPQAAALPGFYSEVEIPGQYAAGNPLIEPLPYRHVKIAQVLPGPAVSYTSVGVVRRVVILGDDGRRYSFTLSTTSSSTNAQDARLLQLHTLFSVVLAKDSVASARHLSTHGVTTVPLSGRHRLTLEVPSTTLLQDVLDKHLRTHAPALTVEVRGMLPTPQEEGGSGADATLPECVRSVEDLIAVYRRVSPVKGRQAAAALAKALATTSEASTSPGGGGGAGGGPAAPSPAPAAAGSTGATSKPVIAALDAVAFETYKALTLLVHEQALTHWAATAMANAEALAGLRLRFARSLSTGSWLSYLLSVQDRNSLTRVGVSLSTGSFLTTEARPSYHSGFPEKSTPANSVPSAPGTIVEADGNVPFRLSRNIVALASPQAVLGTMVAGMVVSSRALNGQTEWVTAYLGLFFRDEAAPLIALATDATVKAHEKERLRAVAAATAEGIPIPDRLQQPVVRPSEGADAGTLLRRAVSNTGKILDRLQILGSGASGPAVTVGPGAPQTVVQVLDAEKFSTKAYNLVLNGAAEKFLARMQATAHPWF